MGGAAALFVLSLVVALAVVHRPLGDYLFRVVSASGHARIERGIYRIAGVDPQAEQSWGAYARGMLAFSAVSVLFLYAALRLQDRLWLSLGLPAVTEHTAWNAAVSFATNTNWQSYAPSEPWVTWCR